MKKRFFVLFLVTCLVVFNVMPVFAQVERPEEGYHIVTYDIEYSGPSLYRQYLGKDNSYEYSMRDGTANNVKYHGNLFIADGFVPILRITFGSSLQWQYWDIYREDTFVKQYQSYNSRLNDGKIIYLNDDVYTLFDGDPIFPPTGMFLTNCLVTPTWQNVAGSADYIISNIPIQIGNYFFLNGERYSTAQEVIEAFHPAEPEPLYNAPDLYSIVQSSYNDNGNSIWYFEPRFIGSNANRMSVDKILVKLVGATEYTEVPVRQMLRNGILGVGGKYDDTLNYWYYQVIQNNILNYLGYDNSIVDSIVMQQSFVYGGWGDESIKVSSAFLWNLTEGTTSLVDVESLDTGSVVILGSTVSHGGNSSWIGGSNPSSSDKGTEIDIGDINIKNAQDVLFSFVGSAQEVFAFFGRTLSTLFGNSVSIIVGAILAIALFCRLLGR